MPALDTLLWSPSCELCLERRTVEQPSRYWAGNSLLTPILRVPERRIPAPCPAIRRLPRNSDQLAMVAREPAEPCGRPAGRCPVESRRCAPTTNAAPLGSESTRRERSPARAPLALVRRPGRCVLRHTCPLVQDRGFCEPPQALRGSRANGRQCERFGRCGKPPENRPSGGPRLARFARGRDESLACRPSRSVSSRADGRRASGTPTASRTGPARRWANGAGGSLRSVRSYTWPRPRSSRTRARGGWRPVRGGR